MDEMIKDINIDLMQNVMTIIEGKTYALRSLTYFKDNDTYRLTFAKKIGTRWASTVVNVSSAFLKAIHDLPELAKSVLDEANCNFDELEKENHNYILSHSSDNNTPEQMKAKLRLMAKLCKLELTPEQWKKIDDELDSEERDNELA